MTDEEYYKNATTPPTNPRFNDYEDFDTGRYDDEYEDIDSGADMDEELTSPFVYGDEPQYEQPEREEEQRPKPKKTKKPKRKKKSRFLKTFLSLLLVVCIICGCAFAYIFSLTEKLNHENDTGHENPYVSSGELMSDKRVKNILLIGVDKADGGVSRSDTNMLVSVDTVNSKIKLISFMRDYWVEIPDNGSAKLNAACAYGGPELTVYTIEKNFGIKIDGFVMVDFDIFISLIDAIGGIEVEVTEREAEFMRNQVTWTDVQAGPSVLLNGKEALLYCRIRYLDSDFMRTYRQRKVITALFNKMKDAEILGLLTTVDEILPQITTNINSMKLSLLAVQFLQYMSYDIEQLQVPFEDTWDYDTINGQSVLVADIDEQRELLKDYMY